ncbi:hypothetical protein MHYP_G00261590 [Metynnis hypsauchen]
MSTSLQRISFSYGRQEKNPVDALRFYSKDLHKPKQLSKDEVSYLLAEKFAEIKVMVFYKGENRDVEKVIKKYINEFWNDLDPVSAVAKLKAWLTDVQQPSSSQQLPVTENDFEVVQYPLDEENDSSKVMLLYNWRDKEDIINFWRIVRENGKEEQGNQ